MPCSCQELPEFAYYVPGRSLSRKLRPLTKNVAKADWRELLQCRVCGTFWRIDVQDKFQERFVWKVGAFRDDWSSAEFVDKQKALLLENRGGEVDEACVWLGCGKKKVKGVAYCIDHLYATGARR
jgi:hypothetical protein